MVAKGSWRSDDRARSMLVVWPGDHLQRTGDVPELPLAELPREVLVDALEMCACRTAEKCEPGLRQPSHDNPRIPRESEALDKPLRHQPIDTPCQRASGHEYSLGELCHLEGATLRSCKSQKDVITVEGNPVPGSKVGIEAPGDVVMGMKQRLPRSKLLVAQPNRHQPSLKADTLLPRLAALLADRRDCSICNYCRWK
jgi:hypothetical protein